MHEMYNETTDRPPRRDYAPYSFRQVCGFFNVPCWPCKTEDAGDGAYGLKSWSEKDKGWYCKEKLDANHS